MGSRTKGASALGGLLQGSQTLRPALRYTLVTLFVHFLALWSCGRHPPGIRARLIDRERGLRRSGGGRARDRIPSAGRLRAVRCGAVRCKVARGKYWDFVFYSGGSAALMLMSLKHELDARLQGRSLLSFCSRRRAEDS